MGWEATTRSNGRWASLARSERLGSRASSERRAQSPSRIGALTSSLTNALVISHTQRGRLISVWNRDGGCWGNNPMRTSSQPDRRGAASSSPPATSRQITLRRHAVAVAEPVQRIRKANLVRAWVTVLDRWRRQGRPTLDRNLSAFTRYYRDEGVISFLPPSELVADWRDDGCPDPAVWIEAKLAAILTNAACGHPQP